MFHQWRARLGQRPSGTSRTNGDILKDIKYNRGLLTHDVILKPSLKLPVSPLHMAFNRWRVATRAKKHIGGNAVDLAFRTIRRWRKLTHLKQMFENYTRQPFFTPIESSAMKALREGASVLAKFILREWRGVAKLQRRRVDDFIHNRRFLIETWRRKTEKRRNHLIIASMYDNNRVIRPIFMTWLNLERTVRRDRDKINRFCRYRLLSKHWDIWEGKRRKAILLNKFIGKWRGNLEFQHRRLITSVNFHNQKCIVKRLNTMRTQVALMRSLNVRCSQVIKKKNREQIEFYLNVWRKMRTWIERNSEKMRTIRAARLAKNALYHWKRMVRVSSKAEVINKRNTLSLGLLTWRRRLEEKRVNDRSKRGCFSAWRHLAQTRRLLRDLQGQKCFTPQFNLPDLINRLKMQKIFKEWKRRALLAKKADVYQNQKTLALKRNSLKSWRLDVNVTCLIKTKPWRLKRRMFYKILGSFRSIVSTRQIQYAKVEDYVAGRNYICFYRAFERWQQAFQARKMEEHLCGQNLVYYQNQQRRYILRVWQLLAAERILEGCKSHARKKQLFSRWRNFARSAVDGCRNRLLSRTLTKWRHSYRDSVAKSLISQTNRRILRISFVSWRTKVQRIHHLQV